MIIRLILAIVLVVIAYKLYQRVFTQKSCIACAKRISKQAAVCHHCNTLQTDAQVKKDGDC